MWYKGGWCGINLDSFSAYCYAPGEGGRGQGEGEGDQRYGEGGSQETAGRGQEAGGGGGRDQGEPLGPHLDVDSGAAKGTLRWSGLVASHV